MLSARGHDVQFLFADRVLPIDEQTDESNYFNLSKIVNYYVIFGKRLFEAAGVEVINLSDLLSDDQISIFDSELNTDKWDVYVDTMYLRYFKVGIIDKKSDRYLNFLSKGRHAAIISEAVGNALVKMNPDRVMITHGSYTTKGPAKDILKEAGIPIVSQGWGRIARSQKFNWGVSSDSWKVDQEWEKVKDIPLNEEQISVINNYTDSRRNHKNDAYIYNHSPEEAAGVVFDRLGLNSNKPVYSMFTNLIWDACSAQKEIAFSNVSEWIYETIEWFCDRAEKQLIIKTHPAEAQFGTNQSVKGLIEKKFPNLPENIKIIPADTDINSWSVINITNIGIVHTSTVGLELALEGLPCLCVSDTYYRQKGFTVDVKNKKEYFEILEGNNFEFDKEQVKIMARRFAYVMFIRGQIPMDYYEPNVGYSARYFKDLDFQKIVDSKIMKEIIESIEEKRDIVMSNELVIELYGKKPKIVQPA